MKRVLLGAILAVTPALAFADNPPPSSGSSGSYDTSQHPSGSSGYLQGTTPQQQGQQGAAAVPSSKSTSVALIQLPSGAQLLGESQVDEIRAFPELQSDTNHTQIEKVVGVEAKDRVYKSGFSYTKTVSFFDHQFKQPGFQQIARTTMQTATAWTVRRPDGMLANLIVRNTSPATFELVQSVGGIDTIQRHNMDNMNMNDGQKPLRDSNQINNQPKSNY